MSQLLKLNLPLTCFAMLIYCLPFSWGLTILLSNFGFEFSNNMIGKSAYNVGKSGPKSFFVVFLKHLFSLYLEGDEKEFCCSYATLSFS